MKCKRQVRFNPGDSLSESIALRRIRHWVLQGSEHFNRNGHMGLSHKVRLAELPSLEELETRARK